MVTQLANVVELSQAKRLADRFWVSWRSAVASWWLWAVRGCTREPYYADEAPWHPDTQGRLASARTLTAEPPSTPRSWG